MKVLHNPHFTGWLAGWLVGCCGLVEFSAADWPSFRGPTGNGMADVSQEPPRSWSATENVVWKQTLPGTGAGSPIVVQDRIFLNVASAYGRQRSLLCLRAEDGQIQWKRTVNVAQEELTHVDNPYCGSTATSDGRLVVTWHGSGGLHCYTVSGMEVWSRDFGELQHLWGYASSPILHAGCVLLQSTAGEKMFVASVRLSDGELLWQTEEPGGRSNAKPGEMWVGSWTTPSILTATSNPQIVCALPTAVVGLDFETGQEVWRCDGLKSERAELVYASPIVANQWVVALGGYQGPALAVRWNGRGNVTDSHRDWHLTKRNPQRIGTPIVIDEHLYLANADGGTLQCLELKSGRECWRERVTGGPHWASIVFAGGALYATNQSGITRVIRPDPQQYQVLAENDIGQPINATPAFAHDRIYLRTADQLWCIADSSRNE